MSPERRTTRLPRLREVTLEDFTLYRLQPNVQVEIDRNVFCLAGANGLGKSSFIAALNYGLTGGVAPPGVRVEQLPKYQREAAAYGSRYFTGRIGELDRAGASIGLKFSVGDMQYSIRRRFFRPHELDYLSVTHEGGLEILVDDPSLDAEERHAKYEVQLLEDTGLQTFPQFVFLQHFVFSFDEHRHLLFWDTRATELVLYLALGLDPSLAKQVDDLRKAAAAAGSQARNAQYQATLARNEVKGLLGQLKRDSGLDVATIDRFQALQADRETLTLERNSLRTELTDARLEFADVSAQLMRKRQEYDEAFKIRVGGRGASDQLHSIVNQLISTHLCGICGTQHDATPASVEQAIRDHQCPLCEAVLNTEASTAGAQAALVRLDAELSTLSRRSTALAQTIDRLDDEVRAKQRELGAVISELSAIEEKHDVGVSTRTDSELGVMRDRIKQLEASIEVALGRKEEYLQRRAEALAAYEPIQAKLKSAWNQAEVEFVPRFRNLAEEFIGLPLQVTLDTGSGIGGNAHLALSVNSTHRRRAEQLSESQRFFLDIALRMSLAQHMTGPTGPACLLIDTPEGALDIAYEAKAGDMFASFTAEGDQVVMTANVNTSQLLMRLAERCGRQRMQLVRMTEWTTLTDVQVEEESLFERAFSNIEQALNDGPSPAGSRVD